MNDVIFLLSTDEYLKYKKSIPQFNLKWWLRSPGNIQYYAFFVGSGGSLSDCDVGNCICVRPALDLDKIKINEYENIFVYCGITWVKIGENIAISELPIGIQCFNKGFYNNYEKSDIRKWLLGWYEKRKNY